MAIRRPLVLGADNVPGELSSSDVLSSVASSIVDGDVQHSPNGDVVHAALQLKQPVSSVADKDITFLGDSITELWGYGVEVQTLTAARTTQRGIRGTCWAQKAGANPQPYYNAMSISAISDSIASGNFTAVTNAANSLFAFDGTDVRYMAALLAAQVWADEEIIAIFAGTNDYGNSSPLGATTDVVNTTFRGAINYTINKIQTAYPEAKIVIIAPMHRTNGSTSANGVGLYLDDYVDALLERGNALNIPVLDLLRKGGVNAFNQTTYLVDGVHPTTEGVTRIAEKIAGFLIEAGGDTMPIPAALRTWGSITPSSKANDADVVHTTGFESVSGAKAFTGGVILAGAVRTLAIWTGFLARWGFGADSSTESGANAGSNLLLTRYDDAGNAIANAFTINRATGLLNTEVRPTFAGNTPWDNGNILLASGTYTPTLTNVTNLTGSTPYTCQYMRVGNVVTVSGKVDINATAVGACALGMTLPIASALTGQEQVGGTASFGHAAPSVARISADTLNDRAQFNFVAPATGAVGGFFSFTYRIL